MSMRPSRPVPGRCRCGLRQAAALLAATLAGCGGGGGGAAVAPVQNEVQLEASALTITGDSGELLVSLADDLRTAPALLQVAIELPPQLQLPPDDRLSAARPLSTLDGDVVDDAFVVMCGDAINRTAVPLGAGPLFRLRLLPTQPRTPGTYQVRLREVRAATSAGDAVASRSTPLTVPVTLQD